MGYIATVAGRELAIDIIHPGEIRVDGVSHRIDLQPIDGQYLYSLLLDGVSYEVFVERLAGVYYVTITGDRFAVEVEDERLRRLRQVGQVSHDEQAVAVVTAPMPGQVVRVLAAPGSEVAADQPVVILEAMKMENEVRSPRAGVLQRVAVLPGQVVNADDTLFIVGDASLVPE